MVIRPCHRQPSSAPPHHAASFAAAGNIPRVTRPVSGRSRLGAFLSEKSALAHHSPPPSAEARMNRAALGLALILHGMANMVLPLRGADAATSGLLLPPVTALYAVAILGFVVT